MTYHKLHRHRNNMISIAKHYNRVHDDVTIKIVQAGSPLVFSPHWPLRPGRHQYLRQGLIKSYPRNVFFSKRYFYSSRLLFRSYAHIYDDEKNVPEVTYETLNGWSR